MTATGVPYYWVWPSWLPFCPFFQLLVFCPERIPSHTHSLSHMHSCRSAPVPMPKHLPHGHIQSPCSSPPLLALSHLLLHHLSSCQSSICTLTWPLTQTNKHWLLSTHREKERWQGEILQDVGENRERVGTERAKEQGGKKRVEWKHKVKGGKILKGTVGGVLKRGKISKVRRKKKTGKIAGRVENLNWHEKVLVQFSILLLYEDWRSFLRIWLTLKDRSCLCKLKNSTQVQ